MMNKSLILTSHIHLHFIVYVERIREPFQRTNLNASDWPLHSLTQQNRVIGYNVQHRKNVEKEI